ncbi:MAG TPA: glycoside hydrolase family 97 N-terminal domain-containing protein [Bryobacteraceae bacterium]|nr:glycoside hydrolase family 97 N-terminal domain-containing protein [Bryobacteraceae bacterium]
MKACKFLLCLLPLAAGAAHAQDDRTVASPDGRLEFRLFTTLPPGNQLNSLAYQIRRDGKLLIDTSCIGLDIHFQEPLLGENVGLSESKASAGDGYNGLFADYLQNSTTGRRIDLEIRVYNDGVALRYLLPQQYPLLDLLIEDEVTEFRFAWQADRPPKSALPYEEREPAGGWIGIFESGVAGFPAMWLVPNGANILETHLPDKPSDPGVAYAGVTPWTGPWRIIALAGTQEELPKTKAVQSLR